MFASLIIRASHVPLDRIRASKALPPVTHALLVHMSPQPANHRVALNVLPASTQTKARLNASSAQKCPRWVVTDIVLRADSGMNFIWLAFRVSLGPIRRTSVLRIAPYAMLAAFQRSSGKQTLVLASRVQADHTPVQVRHIVCNVLRGRGRTRADLRAAWRVTTQWPQPHLVLPLA